MVLEATRWLKNSIAVMLERSGPFLHRLTDRTPRLLATSVLLVEGHSA